MSAATGSSPLRRASVAAAAKKGSKSALAAITEEAQAQAKPQQQPLERTAKEQILQLKQDLRAQEMRAGQLKKKSQQQAEALEQQGHSQRPPLLQQPPPQRITSPSRCQVLVRLRPPSSRSVSSRSCWRRSMWSSSTIALVAQSGWGTPS